MVLFPATLLLSLFSHELLSAWISPQFALCSAPILRWFSLGILLSCIAYPASTFLQATGRARAVATLQLAQVLPFLVLMAWVVAHFGTQAAAALWAARAAVDLLILMRLSRSGPFDSGSRGRQARSLLGGLACLSAFSLPADSLSTEAKVLSCLLASGLAWGVQRERIRAWLASR
jgi:O-antigen/teichoic acid export membrane protein